MTASTPEKDLRSRLLAKVASHPDEVWTPTDFVGLGSRAAVDKTLQRLAATGKLRRISRGLYDRPRKNRLTGRLGVPDYHAVIRAVARRDKLRTLVSGMAAANDIGLTDAVPARIEVLVGVHRKPMNIGAQTIHFKFVSPRRLYWADRPGMRVVQALQWMRNVLAQSHERTRVQAKLQQIFSDPRHGQAIRDDLRDGLSVLPIWMQKFLQELPNLVDGDKDLR